MQGPDGTGNCHCCQAFPHHSWRPAALPCCGFRRLRVRFRASYRLGAWSTLESTMVSVWAGPDERTRTQPTDSRRPDMPIDAAELLSHDVRCRGLLSRKSRSFVKRPSQKLARVTSTACLHRHSVYGSSHMCSESHGEACAHGMPVSISTAFQPEWVSATLTRQATARCNFFLSCAGAISNRVAFAVVLSRLRCLSGSLFCSETIVL